MVDGPVVAEEDFRVLAVVVDDPAVAAEDGLAEVAEEADGKSEICSMGQPSISGSCRVQATFWNEATSVDGLTCLTIF